MPFLTFPLVGALIASRRPHNPIGWILLAHGFLQMILSLLDITASTALPSPDRFRFQRRSPGWAHGQWVPTVGLLGIYLPLLFPDGKLLLGDGARWFGFQQ